MHPDLLAAWWHIYEPGSLIIVEIRDKDIAVAILPLYSPQDEPDDVKLVGGDDVIDYLGPVIKEGYEKRVVDYLISCLLCQTRWHSITFQNVPSESRLLQIIQKERPHDVRIAVEVIEVCPRLQLASTYDQTLMGLDKKQRHELRRKRRRAEEAGADFRIFSGDTSQLSHDIEVFFSLMESSSPEKARFIRNKKNRQFFHELGEILYSNGMLELAFLDLNGEPMAAMWQIGTQDTTMLYNSGFTTGGVSELSPGNALFSMCLEDSIEKQRRSYDFLRGDEAYKSRLGAQPVPLFKITFGRDK